MNEALQIFFVKFYILDDAILKMEIHISEKFKDLEDRQPEKFKRCLKSSIIKL